MCSQNSVSNPYLSHSCRSRSITPMWARYSSLSNSTLRPAATIQHSTFKSQHCAPRLRVLKKIFVSFGLFVFKTSECPRREQNPCERNSCSKISCKHLGNIFKSGELNQKTVSSILEHTASDVKVYRTLITNNFFPKKHLAVSQKKYIFAYKD